MLGNPEETTYLNGTNSSTDQPHKPAETLRIDLPLFCNFAKIDRCFIERCSVWRGTQQNGAEGMTQLTWQNWQNVTEGIRTFSWLMVLGWLDVVRFCSMVTWINMSTKRPSLISHCSAMISTKISQTPRRIHPPYCWWKRSCAISGEKPPFWLYISTEQREASSFMWISEVTYGSWWMNPWLHQHLIEGFHCNHVYKMPTNSVPQT